MADEFLNSLLKEISPDTYEGENTVSVVRTDFSDR